MAKDRGRNTRRGSRPTGWRASAAAERLDPEQVVDEDADEEVGHSGSGLEASGSLPGSVGGTTGVAGENAGIRSPGADVPSFPGISPDEAEKLRRKRQ